MWYVLMMHKGHMVSFIKTRDYDAAYDMAYDLMVNFKREVLIVQKNKAPFILRYEEGGK